MNILFVVPYPYGKAPSQRFRFEQYLPFLDQAGFTYKMASFLDEETWRVLYKPGHSFAKVKGILMGFLRRLLLLFSLPGSDFVFIHREATPIGPPWFEWLAAKVFRKKIIYDFDDAIWLPNTSVNNKMVAGIKWHHKVNEVCKWAYKISSGNAYLQNYASRFNKRAIVNPTTIDTVNLHNQVKKQNTEQVVIGWTGTHSTIKYITPLIPVIKRLEERYDFVFCVISDQEPAFELSSLIYKPWQKETEIGDLLTFNIGVMPLEDDLWAKGKCAFKALQYMALGIPAVVSPVGMNVEVVDSGINGFVCQTEEEWYGALEHLITDPLLRTRMGEAARGKIASNYAVVSNRDNFLGLFA